MEESQEADVPLFVHAMATFMNQMENDDTKTQIAATEKLIAVSIAMGPELTGNTLLPYVFSLLDTHAVNDEVMMNLGEQVSYLLEYVGLPNAKPVLEILFKIATSEDFLVRKPAIDGIVSILHELPEDVIEEVFLPLFKELQMIDWFPARCTYIDLIPLCYENIPAHLREDLRLSVYLPLREYDDTIVRKTAATNIAELVGLVSDQIVLDEVVPQLNTISEDTVDAIRLTAIELGLKVYDKIKSEDIRKSILAIFHKLAADESWRLRAHVASRLIDIQKVIGPSSTRSHLVGVLANLSTDHEDSVRSEVAQVIVEFCKVMQSWHKSSDEVDPMIITQILPIVIELIDDSNNEIEEKVSATFGELCTLFGPEKSAEYLFPTIINLIKVAKNNIRLEGVVNINTCLQVIGFERIRDNLEEMLHLLAGNVECSWRSRRELVVTLYHISKQTNSEYFADKMMHYHKKLLRDPVFSIRKTAPILLPSLLRRYGLKWYEAKVLPLSLKSMRSTSYLQRTSCVFAIGELITPSLAKLDVDTLFDDLRKSIDSKSAKDLFCRIMILTCTLKEILDDEWATMNMSDYDENQSFNDSNEFYMGKVLTAISNDCDFSMHITKSEIECHEDKDCYIESTLVLAIKYFVPSLKKLQSDPVENVRMRAQQTLVNVRSLQEQLMTVKSATWAKELDESIAQSERERLQSGVVAQLNQSPFHDLEYSSDEEVPESPKKHSLSNTVESFNIEELDEIVQKTEPAKPTPITQKSTSDVCGISSEPSSSDSSKDHEQEPEAATDSIPTVPSADITSDVASDNEKLS